MPSKILPVGLQPLVLVGENGEALPPKAASHPLRVAPWGCQGQGKGGSKAKSTDHKDGNMEKGKGTKGKMLGKSVVGPLSAPCKFNQNFMSSSETPKIPQIHKDASQTQTATCEVKSNRDLSRRVSAAVQPLLPSRGSKGAASKGAALPKGHLSGKKGVNPNCVETNTRDLAEYEGKKGTGKGMKENRRAPQDRREPEADETGSGKGGKDRRRSSAASQWFSKGTGWTSKLSQGNEQQFSSYQEEKGKKGKKEDLHATETSNLNTPQSYKKGGKSRMPMRGVDLFNPPENLYELSATFRHFDPRVRAQTEYLLRSDPITLQTSLRKWSHAIIEKAPDPNSISTRRINHMLYGQRALRLQEFVELAGGSTFAEAVFRITRVRLGWMASSGKQRAELNTLGRVDTKKGQKTLLSTERQKTPKGVGAASKTAAKCPAGKNAENNLLERPADWDISDNDRLPM